MSFIHADILKNHLSVERALQFVEGEAFGASTVFVGKVRNQNVGKAVQGVSYDAFEPLARKLLIAICEEAMRRFGPSLKLFIEHFQGRLSVGGLSVVIAVGSVHRKEGYDASRFLIEELKHRVPIWKQEHYVEGDSEWIHGQQCCVSHTKNMGD